METIHAAFQYMWNHLVGTISVAGIMSAMPVVWRVFVWWRVRKFWPKFRQSLDQIRKERPTDQRISFSELQDAFPRVPRKVLRECWKRIAELPYASPDGDGYILRRF